MFGYINQFSKTEELYNRILEWTGYFKYIKEKEGFLIDIFQSKIDN